MIRRDIKLEMIIYDGLYNFKKCIFRI